jgi:hypothetical protein
MSRMAYGFRRYAPLLSLLAVFWLATAAWAGEFTKEFRLDGDALELWDLIGTVKLEAGRGDAFEVAVQVRGEDAEEDLIGFEVDEGGKAHLVIQFPVDEHREFVYPELGRGSQSTLSLNDWGREGRGGWLSRIVGGRRIKVSGRGSGLEVWADVTVRVPRGKKVDIRVGVGGIDAAGVAGALNLDTNSGPVAAHDIQGDLVADTGSGSVELENVTGRVSVDTGSGHVTVTQQSGGDLLVDTGSGGVDITDADCRSLEIDTGSGGVEARGIRADRAKIDTGSGGVTLELDRMGDGRFTIDTGSGGIRLVLPDGVSAHVTADTGSGSISVDLPGVELPRRSRDHAEFTVGQGDARVVLDAGSGSIRITD